MSDQFYVTCNNFTMLHMTDINIKIMSIINGIICIVSH